MQKIVHFEIPAENMERATRFFKICFGWEIFHIPQMNYSLITTGPTDKDRMPEERGFINGGMLKRKAPVETVTNVIDVPSVDEYCKKIADNGGTVLTPKITVP